MADQKPMSAFDLAFNFTVRNEGKFSDNKSDMGGPTSLGITQATYSRWLGRQASVNEVRGIAVETAKSIYERFYWMPLDLEQIKHTGVAMALFDIGVVRGIGVPPKYAQEVCIDHGIKLELDGHMGPVTIAAINSMTGLDFLAGFKKKVDLGFEAIVAKNPSQKVFLKGWMNRSTKLLSLSVEPDLLPILAEHPTPTLPKVEQAPPKPISKPQISQPLPQAPLTLSERLAKAWAVLFPA